MEPANGNGSLISMVAQPFKDGNFRNLILFLGSWNFAVNLDTLNRAIKERVGGIVYRWTDCAAAPGPDCLVTAR